LRVPGVRYVQGRNSYTDTDGTKFGIAIHNTSNDAPAEGEADYATRRTDGTSSHFYVDRDSIIQSLDTDKKAGHAASVEGNQNAIAFEITGTNDKSRAWWLDNVYWPELGRVCAILCQHYGIQVRRASPDEMRTNPKVRAFYSHNDMRLAWGGTSHTDPGPNFPWDRLFDAVNGALNPEEADMTPEQDALLKEIRDLVKPTNWSVARGGPFLADPNQSQAITYTLKEFAAVLIYLRDAVGQLANSVHSLTDDEDDLTGRVNSLQTTLAQTLDRIQQSVDSVDDSVVAQLAGIEGPQLAIDLKEYMTTDKWRAFKQAVADSE
jgi:N-acetyl-anhydromuramyl-L-alanine amidase AmpD